MPFSRWSWRVVIPVAVAFVLLNIGAIKFVRDAYPSDPFQSVALTKCVASDPGFVRFFPSDRTQCYARQPRQGRLEAPSTTQPN